eukprot:2021822-Pleurochrysis_carterae.AAC.2
MQLACTLLTELLRRAPSDRVRRHAAELPHVVKERRVRGVFIVLHSVAQCCTVLHSVARPHAHALPHRLSAANGHAC